MKETIESTLQRLVDLPLWSIGRAGNVDWFAFGNERREIIADNLDTKFVSDFSLHVQCAWRIQKKDEILVASRDRYYPPGKGPFGDLDNFDWDTPGGNRLDELIATLLSTRSENPLIVKSVVSDEVGGVKIYLSDGCLLEIFPDDSLASEYWRLFKPYSDVEHFVVTGHGIEYE